MIQNATVSPKRFTLGWLAIAALLLSPGLGTPAQALTYDFNDGTLQGWNNRVWNTNANSGAGGWVDLATNATTMSASINGGVIQPPSSYNGLFTAGTVVAPTGNTDAHLNTLWLRSPQFYLAATGDLTVQLAQGVSHATWSAPMSDSAVPYAAANSAGWMGVALRTITNNQFVLLKPKTVGSSGTYYTTTFAQAELAPYVGAVCTLDLINADNGGWGWISMDNVFIPGDTSPPGQGKDILSFTFPTYGAATISGTNINLTVPYGTAVTALAPTYAVSYGATCLPASGSTQNFTSPVHYVVTAGNSSTQTYTVTVNVTPASTNKDILTFGPGATITGTAIAWTVPYGTDLTSLSPTYTISALATASPASASTRNFATPQTYTVTAQDNSTKTYTVTVSLTPASSAKSILTMSPGGVITGTNIVLQPAFGTDLSSLAPTYSLSPFALGWPVTGTSLDFRTPQTYTVTAQDGSTQIYSVTASPLPDSPAVINVALGGVRSIAMNNLMNGTLTIDGSQGPGVQAGPVLYGGTTWNDVSGIAASASNLLDSKGVSTTVGFALNAGGYKDGRTDWARAGRLRLFGAGCHADAGNGGGWQPEANTLPTLILTGLDATHTYDLYLAGDDFGASINQYNIGGTFNFTTRVFTGGTTLTASQNPENAGTWVAGVSYVKFAGLTGSTSVAVQDSATSGRYVLNGFQLLDTTPQKKITSFAFPTYGAAAIAGTNISLTVPYGTVVTALAPAYTISYGATCVPASGSSQNFTSPVHYVVTAADTTTSSYTATVSVRPTADPAFTLTAPATWDGRQTITVQATITNWAQLLATGGTNVNYAWSVGGVAVTKQITPGTLTLTRSQGGGPMTVTLVMDNGGWPTTNSVAITVQEPATDAWVVRTPSATEKPVNNQFYARDDTGYGTIYYNGTAGGSPDSVFLNVYSNGVIYTKLSQALVGGAYAFGARIPAGLVVYSVQFGSVTGATTNVLDTETNLVCGDAFIIQGQSNADAASEAGVGYTGNATPWIRTYHTGWETAVAWDGADSVGAIGFWGMTIATNLLQTYNLPICIINGAVGGTRIDQHQANPANHYDTSAAYSIYGNLLNRVANAKLTHGIRALLWHQGEQDQGTGGPFGGDYDYKYYQQYFVDLSAAWKQDYPNLRNYFIYQIWPWACGDDSANDQLRDTQRTLPYLFSEMRIMTTIGVVPGSSCHYTPAGYQNMGDLMSPLVKQDLYGYMPGAVYTAPDLEQAWFTTDAHNEIALQFGQDMVWNPGAPGLFYLDGLAGAVSWGSASGKVIKLQLTAPTAAKTITYLVGLDWQGAGSVQANLLYGANGVAALTFAGVPIAASAATTSPAAPVIGSLLPTTGRTNGGTVVTLTGSNFLSGASVQFGGASATAVMVNSSTQLTATTPPHAPGLVNLILANTNGLSATNQFTYALPPPPATLRLAGQSGTNLAMVWVGGTNHSCLLLSATNVAQPLSTWTPAATNAVGANGLSTNAIPIKAGEPQRFYRLSIPYN